MPEASPPTIEGQDDSFEAPRRQRRGSIPNPDKGWSSQCQLSAGTGYSRFARRRYFLYLPDLGCIAPDSTCRLQEVGRRLSLVQTGMIGDP